MGKNLVEIIVTAEDKASGVLKGISGGFNVLGGVALAGAGVAAGAIAGIGLAAFNASNDTRTAALEMQSQFGMTAEEADRAAKLARDSWANNWGDSIGDVSGVMGGVIQQLGEFGVVSDEAIQGATEDAIALRDSFGVEATESIDAARALMERFGLTSEEAFNFVATGMQDGLNANDDFLDSIREYAPVFEGAGFSAEQMYSIMESGAASGVLGTDKIADAVKEMGLKLNEGSDDTKAAFDTIGMSFDDIAGFVASGDETWADYFDDIVAGINGIEDPIERQKAQVAIFGTMAEDLGVSFTEGLTAAGASMEEFEGATDSLNTKYDSLGSVFEGFKRQAIDAFTPVTDFALGLVNDHLPQLQELFSTVTDTIGSFFGNLEEGMSPLDALIEALWDIAPPELLAGLIDFRDNILPGLMEKFTLVKDAVLEFITPIIDAAAGFVSWKDILIALAVVLGGVVLAAIYSVITALGPILLVAGAVIGIVALLRNAWESNWGDIQGKTQAAWDFIRPKLEAIKDWIVNTVMPAVRDLWEKWVTIWWPAIQTKLEEVWGVVQPILQKLQEWITDTVIPAIRELWIKWTTVWWPAIQTKIEDVWAVIQPIWESIRLWAAETIPPIIDALKGYFQTTFDAIRGAIQPVKDLWNGFVDAVQGFWNWLQGKSFNINTNSPPPTPGGRSIETKPLISVGTPVSAASGRGTAAGAATTVINIDARGAASGAAGDIRRAVDMAMREYGSRADIRMRTS